MTVPFDVVSPGNMRELAKRRVIRLMDTEIGKLLAAWQLLRGPSRKFERRSSAALDF